MKEKNLVVIILLAFIIALVIILIPVFFFNFGSKTEVEPTSESTPSQETLGSSPLDATYIIEGKEVTLTDGKTEEQVPYSAATLVTQSWNQPEEGDLDADGVDDASFILTQELGSTGASYYVVASLNVNNQWKGTNGILLGEEIAPQTMFIKEGIIIVNYAERTEGDPMSTPPSIGTSKRLIVEDSTLKEIQE